METLSEAQRTALIEHMKEQEDATWSEHALWALRVLKIAISPQDCAKLFMQSMF